MNGAWFDGFVGQDPKDFGNSIVFCVNCVAKDKNEKKDNWIDVVAFGKEMEAASQIQRGDKVFIAGTLDQNKYTNKNGVSIDKLRVIARVIKIEERAQAYERPVPPPVDVDDPFASE